MKKTLLLLTAVLAASFAWGDVVYDVTWNLNALCTNNFATKISTSQDAVEYTSVSHGNGDVSYTVNGALTENIISNVASKGTGAYLMANIAGAALSNDTKLPNEGKVLTLADGAEVHLYARTGRAGETLAFVLDYGSIGDGLTSVSFTTGAAASTDATMENYLTMVAVVGADGVLKTGALAATDTMTSTGTTLSLDLSSLNGFSWGSGDKIVAAITSSSIYGYKTKTTISGVKLTVTIPEPATATLSLLALAGLAARRRRK